MMRIRRRAISAMRAGFTLVETIAAILVLAALGSIASTLIMTSVDGFTRGATAAQLHSEASIALDRIDRELRNIVVSNGRPNISSVTATSIAWNTDYSLMLSGGSLRLVIDGGSQKVLLTDVTDFQVRAYNETNTPLATTLSGAACDPIRRLMVSVTVSRSGVSETLRTKLFIRSLMSGPGGS